jgi:hypothetical protein
MGQASLRAMRDRPGFPEAVRATTRIWQMPADGEARAFAESMRDLGRLMGCLWAIFLHNTEGGLTLARLTALMEAGKVSGAGRARALLVYLQFVGYIEPVPHVGDGRVRRYAPTPRLLAGWGGRLQRDFAVMATVSPAIAAFRERFGEPAVFDQYGRLTGELFVHYMMVRDERMPGPSLEVFSQRYAGIMMLAELLAKSEDGVPFPPVRPIRYSVAAIARGCGVSRTQVRKALRDGAAAGFLELPEEGLAVPTPLLAEHLELMIAGQFVGCEWAAERLLSEFSDVAAEKSAAPTAHTSNLP